MADARKDADRHIAVPTLPHRLGEAFGRARRHVQVVSAVQNERRAAYTARVGKRIDREIAPFARGEGIRELLHDLRLAGGGRDRGVAHDRGLDLVARHHGARHAGAGQRHDTGEHGVARSDHRRNQPALAVANERDPPAIDAAVLPQPADFGAHVVGFVESRRRRTISGGSADAAIVDP